jgi:hypothetical protein
MAEKYGVYLIYILAGSLYFLRCRVTNAHWIGWGAAPGRIILAFSSRLIRYKHRKLLAKDLIENRSLFVETLPP